MKILLFLMSLVLSDASPFQWEDETTTKPKLDTHKKTVKPIKPSPNKSQISPSGPSYSNPTNTPSHPFDDPFFSGSMSIHDMHQRMRERQEALMRQFGSFFDDPFFQSPMGFGLPPRGFQGQGRFNQGSNQQKGGNPSRSSRNQKNSNNRLNPFSNAFKRNINGGLEVLNKKGFIVVQKIIDPKANQDYQVNLQGRSVTVTSQTKQQNEKNSQYGRSFSQSYSSSTQSVLLPEDVMSDFTQRIVGDKLVLVFQKK